MKYRDVEKEGWAKFEDVDLDETISNKELGIAVYNAYKAQVKYTNGKEVNKYLKERFDNLDNLLRPLKDVTSVEYIKNGVLESSNDKIYNDFLVITVDDKVEILLNITTGEDLSYNVDTDIALIGDVTKIKILYSYNKNNYQYDLDIGKIESAILYKNAEIYNSTNDRLLYDSDFIEIKDIKGNYFIIDILHNEIFKRNQIYYLKEKRFTRKNIIFKRNLPNKFKYKLLSHINFYYDG